MARPRLVLSALRQSRVDVLGCEVSTFSAGQKADVVRGFTVADAPDAHADEQKCAPYG